MRLLNAIVFVIISFLSIGHSYSSQLPSSPIHLAKYNETIVLEPNGDAISHISLLLKDTCLEFYLPLIVSSKITLLNSPPDVYVKLLSTDTTNYLLIRSIEQTSMDRNIELDILYNNLLPDDHFWNLKDERNLMIDYADVTSMKYYIDNYKASILLPENLTITLPVEGSELSLNEFINIKKIETGKNEKLNLLASNLGFADIDLIMVLKKSSFPYFPYFVIIILLVAVYTVFLRHIFAG